MEKTLSPQGNVQIVPEETKDLYLAAALHCEGCKYLGIDRTDHTRMVFKFEGGELSSRVVKEWYQDVLVVSATSYAKSLRTMKSLIHA